ncbi:hypothetical protein [Sphingomonas koreensis]
MRYLAALIVVSIAGIAAGYVQPERFGLLGALGWVTLFVGTVLIGALQLKSQFDKRS